jgi:hypothetical protein
MYRWIHWEVLLGWGEGTEVESGETGKISYLQVVGKELVAGHTFDNISWMPRTSLIQRWLQHDSRSVPEDRLDRIWDRS